jgi:hypothetical protein
VFGEDGVVESGEEAGVGGVERRREGKRSSSYASSLAARQGEVEEG